MEELSKSFKLTMQLGASTAAVGDGAGGGEWIGGVPEGCSSFRLGRSTLRVVWGGDHRLSQPHHLKLLGQAVMDLCERGG